jgi:hypothetical protein
VGKAKLRNALISNLQIYAYFYENLNRTGRMRTSHETNTSVLLTAAINGACSALFKEESGDQQQHDT